MSRDPSADHAKQLLLDFIRRMRALRDQRRDINADIAELRTEEKDAGFDAKRIEMVVRWQEECEKLGREVVDEAEAVFDLYRSVVDGEGKNLDEIMTEERDRALLEKFAPVDQQDVKGPTRKQREVANALAAAACNRAMRESGRGGV